MDEGTTIFFFLRKMFKDAVFRVSEYLGITEEQERDL